MPAGREVFAGGEDCRTVETPYAREKGHSWRYAETQCSLLPEPPPADRLGRGAVVLALILGVPAAALALARLFACWLLFLPGLMFLCVPVCIRAAIEIHRLWRYWDGREQLVEDWPALTIARTSAAAVLFAGALGLGLFAVVCGFWGFRLWVEQGTCPF